MVIRNLKAEIWEVSWHSFKLDPSDSYTNVYYPCSTVLCGCIGAVWHALQDIDRLCALTVSTLRVYLCFGNTTRRCEVSCVPVYALYPSRLRRTWEAFLSSASYFLHSKKIMSCTVFSQIQTEKGGLFSKPVNLIRLFLVQKYISPLSYNCTLDIPTSISQEQI